MPHHHHFVLRAADTANEGNHDVAVAWETEDRDRCVAALRATLHLLRDRLPLQAMAHFAAQLPTLIRGLFFEGWSPTGQPARIHRTEALDRVRAEAGLDNEDEALLATRVVAQVLWKHTGDGVMTHVIDTLPVDLVDLFS
jgi:uncharacterized protein (DUF2267 family)